MKHFFLVWCLLMAGCACFSQVRGVVIDETDGSPLIGASVKAFGRDSVQLCGVATGVDGEFSIPNDSSLIGYIEIFYTGYDAISLPVTARPEVYLGSIGLQPSSVMLSGVTVTGETRMMNATTETILLTDSIRASANSAAMMMGNLPGFKVDWITENVSIGHDKDVPIIVNGHKVGLQYAKSINPKRIKLIQIQRYPPGEFSEVPILINIMLYEDYVGWDVSASATGRVTLRNKHSNRETAAADATLSTQKWNAYVSTSYYRSDIYEAASFMRDVAGEEPEETNPIDIDRPNFNNLYDSYSMRIGVDRSLGKNHLLSAQTWLDHADSRTSECYDMVDGPAQDSHGRYKSINSCAGLYYQGLLADRLLISSNILYNYYDVDEWRDFTQGTQSSLTKTDGSKDYVSFNTDAGYYFNRWDVTLGYNYTWRKYRSVVRGSTDAFVSKENRNRVGVTVGVTPGKAMSMRFGVNMLHIGNSQNGLSDNHVAWQPRAQIYWRPLKWMRLRTMYNNYVVYPNLDQLSPVAWRISGNMVQVGNPALRSMVMNKVDVYLTLFDCVTFIYMWKRSDNEIIDWYELTDAGHVAKTYVNCDYLHQYIGVTVDKNFGKGFNINFVGNYQPYKRWHGGSSNTGRTWYGDLTGSWTIGHTNLTVQGEYFVRHDMEPLPQGKLYEQQEVLDFSANYMALKNKLSVSVRWTIPVNLIDKVGYTKISIPGFRSEAYTDGRVNASRLMATIRYSFGKGKVNKIQKEFEIDSEK